MVKSGNREKRIGILGGTFNPIHLGHLNLACSLMKKLSLDKVIFVPSHIPPHKKIKSNIRISDRLNMVRIAIRGERKYLLSLYEIKRLRTSYSIITLRYFKKRFGSKNKLFFIMGADSLIGIYSWKNIRKALDLVQFVVASRPGYAFGRYPCQIKKIQTKLMNISSTKIRSLVKNGKTIKGLVPLSIENYIRRKKLYIT